MTRTKSLLPIDEINALVTYLEPIFNGNKVSSPDVIDDILDILIMSYTLGTDVLNLDLGVNEKSDINAMDNSINKSIDGKTWDQRIEEYIDEYNQETSKRIESGAANEENKIPGTTNSVNSQNALNNIKRVIETEAHRVYVEGAMDAANSVANKAGSSITKKWVTMLDNRVRATHEMLEGVTIGVNEYFNTPDGDRAQGPGGFGSADNNVGCRCELMFSK